MTGLQRSSLEFVYQINRYACRDYNIGHLRASLNTQMLISEMLMFMSELNCDKNSLFNSYERVWLPITTGNKIHTPLHTSQGIHLVNGVFVSKSIISNQLPTWIWGALAVGLTTPYASLSVTSLWFNININRIIMNI